MLPFRVFKEKPHISAKLVKTRDITAIGKKIHLNLIGKHDKSVIDVDIWQQSNLSILIIKNCDFEVEIVTCAAKFVFILVDLSSMTSSFEYWYIMTVCELINCSLYSN